MLRNFFIFACCLLTADLLEADLNTNAPGKKPPKPLPGFSQPTAQPVEVSGEVDRGGRVKLLLRGISAADGPIEFNIVRPPTAGKIISSKHIGEDVLEVLYEHGGGKRSKMDTFVYAVRRQGLGPFSPSEVTVHILDQAAKITGPELVEFAPLEIGGTDTQELVLINEGGTTAAGRMEVSPPWRIEGPTDFRISGGGAQKVTLTFAPDSPGEIGGRLLLQDGSVLEIPLRGNAIAPFSVITPAIALQPLPSGERGGALVLQNNTAHPVEVKITSDLGLPASVDLKFGEVREIPLKVPGGKSIAGKIGLSAGLYTTSVAVGAAPSPASVQLVSASTIDLAGLEAGKTLPVSIRLRNTGGLPATLVVVPTEHLQLAQTNLTIESEGELTLNVLVVAPQSGDLQENISVRYGDRQSLEIPVRASLLLPGAPAAPALAENTALPPVSAPLPGSLALEVKKDDPAFRRHAFPLQVVERQKNALRLRWKAPPSSKPWRFALEYRILRLDAERRLEIAWLPVPDLKIAPINDSFEALIPDLDPRLPWTFRVLATPGDGGHALTSAVLTSRTAPAFHLQIDWRWLLYAALAVSIGLVLRQRWQRRAVSF